MLKNKKLLLVLLLAFVVRLFFLLTGGELGHVESRYAWWSSASFTDLLVFLQEEGVRPPLYCWLLEGWSFFSQDPAWLRLLTLALSLATVYLLYRATAAIFGERTGLAAGILAATSPLMALSAGTSATPYGLDLFCAGLVLATFQRLLTLRGRWGWVAHALALAAGAYTNAFLLALLPAELLYLLLHVRRTPLLFRRWGLAAAAALLLFAPWLPASARQLGREAGHDVLITKDTGLRVSCLLTELSLGRLYAWRPPTPVLSLLPAPPAESGGGSGPGGDRPAPEDASWLQAVQMVFLGCFVMLAMVGVLAGLGIGVFIPSMAGLPTTSPGGGRRFLARRNRNGDGYRTQRRFTLMPLVFFLVPLALGILLSTFHAWKFDGSLLVFLVFPFLAMAARGLGALEWRPMFGGALLITASAGLLYGVFSQGMEGMTEGSRASAGYLVRRFDPKGGDVLVHGEPLTYYPLLYHTRGRLEGRTFVTAGRPGEGRERSPAWGGIPWMTTDAPLSSCRRVWWIDRVPEGEGSYPPSSPAGGEAKRAATSRFLPPRRWAPAETRRFGNLVLIRYDRRPGGE